MEDESRNTQGYILVAAIGALAGGIFAIVITKTIPKMMSRMMSGMMQGMMAHMRESGCDPSEM